MAPLPTPHAPPPHRTGEARGLLARHGPWLAGTAVLLAAALLLQRWLAAGDDTARKPVPQVTQIKLVPPPPAPPPPPPPPRPQEPPPTPLRETPRMRDVTPDPKPVAPAPAQAAAPAALDAEGTAGSDGFGLAGKPGGSDWIGGEGGIGGLPPTGAGNAGGSAEGFYAALVQGHVRGHLQRARSLTGSRYRATFEVWLDADGRASRVELLVGSGEASIDQALRQALLGMPPVPRTPPQDLPQPVVLQVVSS